MLNLHSNSDPVVELAALLPLLLLCFTELKEFSDENDKRCGFEPSSVSGIICAA